MHNGIDQCPECRNGKHQNCDGWTLDENDEMTTCKCDCRQ